MLSAPPSKHEPMFAGVPGGQIALSSRMLREAPVPSPFEQ
jgi:hypothetical protein